jgi:hypothetical protein
MERFAVMSKESKHYPTLMPACAWVLLADKGEARAALVALRPVLARHQALWPDITFTLSFNAIEGEMRICIAHLEGKEIHDARQLADLDTFLQSVPLSQHDRSFWELDGKAEGST